jgi:hypothetical protein
LHRYELLRRPLTVRAVSQVQRYFQHLRPLEHLDAEDGIVMATMLVDSAAAFKKGSSRGARSKMGRLALSVMSEKNTALRELHRQHAWFSPMLIKVLNNAPAPPSTAGKRLEELTAADGGKIGKSMSAMLIGNATAAAAVDEWMRTFPSMKAFAERAPFFQPFMETVATQQLHSADWGLKFRVFLGAAFSTLDMSSDAFMVSKLFATGDSGKAWSIVAMVTINMALQLCLVSVQKHKRPGIMARDMALTCLCLKPAVDALRVVQTSEKEHYEVWDPDQELMFTKGIEVNPPPFNFLLSQNANAITQTMLEALPAAFIQANFIITRISNGDPVSMAAFGSIATSVMAVSYTMQTIAYVKQSEQ